MESTNKKEKKKRNMCKINSLRNSNKTIKIVKICKTKNESRNGEDARIRTLCGFSIIQNIF